MTVGRERLDSIDSAALTCCPAGGETSVRGTISAVPRRAHGEVRIRIATKRGRVQVEAFEPIPDLAVGSTLRATGTLRDAEEWEITYLRRHGINAVLDATELKPLGGTRSGLTGLTDEIRARAERAVGEGMEPAQAALARGFVLGQDDRIDPRTVEEFKRSGLAHLLAVSGQNVILLALLVTPILGLLGAGLKLRLWITLALIALYVPVTGAGPSIQRAGVMGAAGIVAGLAERPGSRWYAVGLAAAVTLVVNPLAVTDVGWQLSFAAVIGILLWSAPLRDFTLRRLQPDRIDGSSTTSGPGSINWQRGLAEGIGMTVAATISTAPLMAHHFEVVSIAALPANLLALPAVAPVMWLGMMSSIAGQIPGIPVGPMNALAEPLIGYIGAVASIGARPSFSQLPVRMDGAWTVVVTYVLMVGGAGLLRRWSGRRESHGLSWRSLEGRPRVVGVAVSLVALLVVGSILGGSRGAGVGGSPPAAGTFRMIVLDVGQGDSILLEPGDGDPVLVDAGDPGDATANQLRDYGVERLAAVMATHPQSDHTGGIPWVLEAIPTRALLYAEPDEAAIGAARAVGTEQRVVAAGDRVRSGSMIIDVIWPSPQLLGIGPADDPNTRSLVLRVRWHGFTALLTGDGEAEAVPVDPGPIDVLKVAHHGSVDAGLPNLLARSRPRLAAISVGEGNRFGHPTSETLQELGSAGVPVLRTDQSGAIEVVVGDRTWSWRTER